jgi:predicted ester cyclase
MLNSTLETGTTVLSPAAIILGEELVLGLEKGRVAEGRRAESNKDLCRRFIQKICNEGELSLMWDFMSPDVVNHELADAIGEGELPEGRNVEWMADLVFLYRHAFPDLHFEIQDQIAEGDRVVTCLRMQGTQENALMTIAATGRKIDVAGIRVDRITGDKIVESWFHLDVVGMLRQLDALVLNTETAPGAGLPTAGWNLTSALPRSAAVS